MHNAWPDYVADMHQESVHVDMHGTRIVFDWFLAMPQHFIMQQILL